LRSQTRNARAKEEEEEEEEEARECFIKDLKRQANSLSQEVGRLL